MGIIVGSFGWRLAAILGLPLKIIIHVYKEDNHYVGVVPALPVIFETDSNLNTLKSNICEAAMKILIQDNYYMRTSLYFIVIHHKDDDDILEA